MRHGPLRPGNRYTYVFGARAPLFPLARMTDGPTEPVFDPGVNLRRGMPDRNLWNTTLLSAS